MFASVILARPLYAQGMDSSSVSLYIHCCLLLSKQDLNPVSYKWDNGCESNQILFFTLRGVSRLYSFCNLPVTLHCSMLLENNHTLETLG